MSRSEEAAIVRRGKAEDVEQILDLLAFYERSRSYFEPFYLSDPSYRPEQSWVAEQDGRLLAHLRVFDREILVGGTALRVAAVGNVITAPAGRGRGHAGRLLEAMLAELPDEGFAYSLLRAYRPALYERHGWAPIEEQAVRAKLTALDPGSFAIEPFADEDLPEVMRLYEESNAERTGPTVRSPGYWRGQLEWLEEDRDGFLVARGKDGTLAGYVRSRAGGAAVEILELGLRTGEVDVGRALLSAAAARRGGLLRGRLPPSLRRIFRPNEMEVVGESGLMGRVINLAALVTALGPAWLGRVRASGTQGGSFRLSTNAGHHEVRVSDEGVVCDASRKGEPSEALDEGRFAHLLFRGFDGAADERIGANRDPSLLRVLFPEQDFVIWRADAF
jgi:predicted N-acetyltransferase YhbS